MDLTANCGYLSHSAQFTQHAHEYLSPAIEPGFLCSLLAHCHCPFLRYLIKFTWLEILPTLLDGV